MTLNPSSILDLKAELHKRYDSFNRAKLNQKSEASQRTVFKSKKSTANEKVDKGKKTLIKTAQPIDEEEELALKKSRLALEAKTKLYEKIISNKILIDDEQNDTYLVDFQRKVLYEEEPTSKKPITNSQQNQSSVIENVGSKTQSRESSYKSSCTSTEVPENTFDPDQPIHYQNLQFNEIREHGTGYFAFSTNPEKRKEQMEELNSMRRDTEKQLLVKENILKKRKAMLQARLAKVCERKNINQSVLESLSDQKNETEDKPAIDLESIPMPEEETPPSPDKETKVRPWDIGKNTLQAFVPAKKKRTHKSYIEGRREERDTEFAPPTFYS